MGAKNSKVQEKYKNKKIKREKVNLLCIPARVDKVIISGLDRTRDDYVQRAANNLFKAENFQQVMLECNNTLQYLNELGIFNDIRIYIDVSSGKNATPNGYVITFHGNEISKLVGAIGTEIDQDEGFLTSELATPNLWGRGERIVLQAKYSNCKTTDINLKVIKPYYHTILGDFKPETSFSLFRHTSTVPISAYKTYNVGFLTDLTFISKFPVDITHSFQYELSFRELFTTGKHSPFFVRENCGPRMASLIRHIATFDQRDNSVFPKYGIYLKLLSEYSGLGGNICYKSIMQHSEFNMSLFGGLVAQLCCRFGAIKLSEKDPNIPISSLYTLGGPSSLRGFKYGGVGPHVDGFATGIQSFWAAGLHLWSPMPFSSYFGRLSNNLRTHFFYNFGNCNSFSTDKMRVAAGIGLAYRIGERARIEFNYCWPLEKQPTDQVRRGFQFGIGYEFI